MRKVVLATLSVDQLVQQFTNVTLAQDKALLENEFPQAGEAGMSLINLDRGIFEPS
jgi:hypothetical protein